MGTTISALLVARDTAFVAQVGDSRIYRLRAGAASQLTEDHTLVREHVKAGILTEEQARRAPYQNVITRAVGNRDWVEVDTHLEAIVPGDRFMLCSDGLHSYLEERELPELLAGPDLGAVAKRFIVTANGRGGKDNITTILVECSAG